MGFESYLDSSVVVVPFWATFLGSYIYKKGENGTTMETIGRKLIEFHDSKKAISGMKS